MNKHNSLSILNIFFLIATALSSGCGAVTAVPSPAIISMPTQTLTATAARGIFHPKGMIFYSDTHHIYSIDLQTQKTKTVFETAELLVDTTIIKNKLYITTSAINNQSPYLAEIIRLDLDGTNREQLTSTTEENSSYFLQSISPNENYLVYYGRRTILILNTKTNSIQSITEEDSHRYFSISWSPDSKTVFFLDAVFSSSGWGKSRLLEYSIDNESLETILPDFPDPSFILDPENPAGAVTWSPDKVNVLLNLSSDFTYSSNKDVEPFLYIFDTADKSLIPIKIPGQAMYARWSADGSTIALEVWVNNQPSLFLLHIKTQELIQIPNNNHSSSFTWLPSNNQILYTTNFKDQTRLNALDVEKGKIRQITVFEKDVNLHNFTWSPDKKSLIYLQSEIGPSSVCLNLLDLTSMSSINISCQDGDWIASDYWAWNYQITWSPNSNYFAYFTKSTDTQQFLNIQSLNNNESIKIQFPNNVNIIQWLYL